VAIAFDVATDGLSTTGTTLSWSHTCTGSNLCLIVATVGDLTTDKITGVTYNGVAMTKLASVQTPVDRWLTLWGLVNPASGAHTVTVTASSSTFMEGGSASYIGVGSIEGNIAQTNTATAGSASVTGTITTSAANCWTVAGFRNDDGAASAGAGTTLRGNFGDTALAIMDSNAALAAGSHTLTANEVNNPSWAVIIASLAPSGTAVAAVANTDVGSTRNRPGRGPYSLGRFFRPSVDAYANQRVFNVDVSEAAAAADSMSSALGAVGALAEVGTASDLNSSVLIALAALAEVANAADALSAIWAGAGAVVESGATADSILSAINAIAAIAESGAAADITSSGGQIYSAQITEAGSASDQSSAELDAISAVTDAASASDQSSVKLDAIAQTSDIGAAADSVSWGGQIFSVNIAEAANAADLVSAAQILVSQLSQSANASDVVSALAALQSSFAEAGNALDTLASGGDFLVAIIESGNAQDAVNWVGTHAPPGAQHIVVMPYDRRIVVAAYRKRITLN
jgi:hypothetical protein